MNDKNQNQTAPLLSVESSDLLACPFCGEKPKYSRRVESEIHPGNYWPEMVQCLSCKIAFRTDENGVNSSTEKWNTERTQKRCNETADDYQETDKAMEVEDPVSDDFKQALKIMTQSLAGKLLYETFCKSQSDPTPWSWLNAVERNKWAALVDLDIAIKSAKIHVSNREHSHHTNPKATDPKN